MTTYNHTIGIPFVLLEAPSDLEGASPTSLTLRDPVWDGAANAYAVTYDFGTYANFYLPYSSFYFTLGYRGALTTITVKRTVNQLASAHSGTLLFPGSGDLTGDMNPLDYYVQVRVENPLSQGEGTFLPAQGAGGNRNNNLPFTSDLTIFANNFTVPGFTRIDAFGSPIGSAGDPDSVRIYSFFPADNGQIRTMPMQNGLIISIQITGIPAAGSAGNYGPGAAITFRYAGGAGSMAVYIQRIAVITDVSVGVAVAAPLRSRPASIRARFRQG